jgi:hypothetical protein
MILNLCRYWKHLIILFIALSFFIILTTPGNNEPNLVTYIYASLAVLLAVLGGILILIPIVLLVLGNHKRSKFEIFLWIIFMVMFNVMGSFITYFIFRDLRE